MGDILVAQAGQQRGPFTEAEVLRMAQAGELSPADLWWREGMANWEPLSSLLPAQGPPPIPNPPPALPPPLPSEFPRPRPPVPARSTSPLLIVLCVVGGLVAIIFVIAVVAAIAIPNIAMSRKAALHGRDAVAPADASPGNSASAASAPTEKWREHSLDVLKFKTPFAMSPFDLSPDDEEAKKLIVVSRALEGEDDLLYVMAGVVTYTDNARVMLDGAVKGAIDGMVSSLEIPVPQYQAVKTTIDGLPARQVDTVVNVNVDGVASRVGIRGLFVESGQRLVQLLVVEFEPGAEATARAKAVLASASVAGPDER